MKKVQQQLNEESSDLNSNNKNEVIINFIKPENIEFLKPLEKEEDNGIENVDDINIINENDEIKV